MLISQAQHKHAPQHLINMAMSIASQGLHGLYLRIINKKSYFTVKLLLSFRVNHFNNAVMFQACRFAQNIVKLRLHYFILILLFRQKRVHQYLMHPSCVIGCAIRATFHRLKFNERTNMSSSSLYLRIPCHAVHSWINRSCFGSLVFCAGPVMLIQNRLTTSLFK